MLAKCKLHRIVYLSAEKSKPDSKATPLESNPKDRPKEKPETPQDRKSEDLKVRPPEKPSGEVESKPNEINQQDSTEKSIENLNIIEEENDRRNGSERRKTQQNRGRYVESRQKKNRRYEKELSLVI